MNYAEESLKLHYQWRGKLDTVPKMSVSNKEDLSLAYTPGVAQHGSRRVHRGISVKDRHAGDGVEHGEVSGYFRYGEPASRDHAV